MDAKKQKPLSDSEVQKLRDDLAETERRRWLYRLIRTGLAWIAGTLAAVLSLANGARDFVEWVTRK